MKKALGGGLFFVIKSDADGARYLRNNLCINLKKQLTADERRYTQRNQRHGTNIGLTKR